MNIITVSLTIILLIIILFIIAISINNFTITAPDLYIKQNVKYILISVFLSIFIVGYIIRRFNIVFITSVIILSYIFFVICTTVYSNNYIDSLPSVLDPLPPHLGLNGVSMSNIYTGTNIDDR
jgi:hypothetical protein